MANQNDRNKTTVSHDVASKKIEKIIPTVVPRYKDKENERLLLDDECDSHRLINIFEIPNYLSFTTNKTFEKMAKEKIYHSNSTINIQALEEITILMHQLNIIDLEKSLWTIYFKSGTAGIVKANESTLKIWPTSVKSMIQLMKRTTTISDINEIDVSDNTCLKFVTEHLRELNEQQKQIQEQLSQKKKQFYGYTNRIEEILQTFIQQHIEFLRIQYEYKIKLVELNYQESVLEQQFLQQNPNEQQKQLIERLFHRKYDHETAKQEVLLMKQQVSHNKLPKLLDSIDITLPSSIHSLTDTHLREHLEDRHYQIMKQYKNEMIKIYIETVEAKLQESQKLFDNEIAKLWQDQRSLAIYQRLNQTIINLIDRRLILIISKVECIYNYKKLQ